MVEAEIGMMLTQPRSTEDWPQPPEAVRGKEGSLPRASRGA